MALNSVLSLAYYAPLVNVMYRKVPSEQVLAGKSVPFALALPMVVMLVMIIVLGFVPQLMEWVTLPAAESLLVMFGS